jgi:hypothetical protein
LFSLALSLSRSLALSLSLSFATAHRSIATGVEKKGKEPAKDCEEYFYLAATAVKIGIAIKYVHHSDEVFKTSSKLLYDRAIEADVPFHEWHDWLVEQLNTRLRTLQPRPDVAAGNGPPPATSTTTRSIVGSAFARWTSK